MVDERIGQDQLNDEQRAVVAHDDGPLLVLAGPGSGKTRVLVERFVRLVREGRATPSEILVLAYNADAAAQMQRRVSARLGIGDYPIATFHAFAKRALEELGWMAGLPSSFRLLGTDVEKWLRMQAVLGELRPSFFYAPTRPRAEIDRLLKFIERAKQEAVTAERLASWAEARRTGQGDPQDQEAERYGQVAAVYAALNERYAREGAADFEDLVLRLAQGLRSSAALRTALSSRYRYVMVDEFQDTNYTQSLVLEQLVPHPHNLVVVADDDQSVYRFRGASLTNVVRFERTYPDAPRPDLGENYRCPAPVVDASAAIVALYEPRRLKRLRSSKEGGAKVRIVSAPDLHSEAGWIARECRRLAVEEDVLPTEIAVLTRAKYQLLPIALALSSAGLPYDLRGGGDFFSRDEVKDVLALVRAAVDPHDDLALIRLWRLPHYALSDPTRSRLWPALRESGRHVIYAGAAELALLADDTERQRLELLRSDVRELAAGAQAWRPEELMHEILDRTEYVGVTRRLVGAEFFQAAANLRRLLDLVTTFAADSPDASAQQLLAYLELASDAGVGEADPALDLDGIRLSSAHSAKGLEFRHVFIANAVERRFPVPPRGHAIEVPAELAEEELVGADPYDEERRLFYVAMTRASESLTITYAASYHERARAQVEASRYIGELRRDVPALLDEVSADPVVLPALGARIVPMGRRRGEPLTITQLLSFGECPRQFWYAYEAELPSRRERAPLLGTIIHHVLEQASLRRRDGHDVSPEDLLALLEDAWRAERFDKLAWADLKDEAARMLRAYTRSAAWQGAAIVEPEQDFQVELMGNAYRGRFDRVERSGGRLLIVDYKTGHIRTADELRGDRQFGFYRLAAERAYDTREIDLEAHYLATGEVVRVEKDDAQLERDGKWVYAITRGIAEARARGAFPATPSDFKCPSCPYRLVCDEGRAFLRRRLAGHDEGAAPAEAR